MAYNGSGTFLINTAGQPVVAGTVISSTTFNALTADLATGLSTVITKDGQTTVTANIPMASFKFTGLGVGSAAGDSANLSQVQSTVTKLLASVSGADTVTATASPTLAAYAAGQMFYFVAAGDNTTSVTLNIDALGAKAVTRDGSVALAAADIKSGEVVVVVYDGTRFQVVSQLNSAGNATFANVSITSALNVGGVVTLSGGTANGVAYLNGSKVVTSGTALVFDGTNLGVNCTPSSFSNFSYISINGATGSILNLRSGNTSQFEINTTGTLNNFTSLNTLPFVWSINSGEKMRLDASGNLGLGVVPSAWNTAGRAIEVGKLGNAVYSTAANTRYDTSNAFLNSSGDFKYAANGNATSYVQFNGTHAWNTAASGTAGNTVTFTTAMTLDSSGNLGIGTTSPSSKLHVVGSGNPTITLAGSDGAYTSIFSMVAAGGGSSVINANGGSNALVLQTNSAERCRITSGGEFLLGTTTVGDGFFRVSASANAYNIIKIDDTGSTGGNYIQFLNSAGNQAGSINHNGTTSVNYGSGSDYRLKENIQPMLGALSKVAALKPCTYKWKEDGSNGQGFIAHELQEIIPDAVVGKKDDVDKNGKPKHQMVDTSFVVATLTAAIQEQQAIITALTARLTALESK